MGKHERSESPAENSDDDMPAWMLNHLADDDKDGKHKNKKNKEAKHHHHHHNHHHHHSKHEDKHERKGHKDKHKHKHKHDKHHHHHHHHRRHHHKIDKEAEHAIIGHDKHDSFGDLSPNSGRVSTTASNNSGSDSAVFIGPAPPLESPKRAGVLKDAAPSPQAGGKPGEKRAVVIGPSLPPGKAALLSPTTASAAGTPKIGPFLPPDALPSLAL